MCSEPKPGQSDLDCCLACAEMWPSLDGLPASTLLGRRSACLKLSSSEAAGARVKLGRLEGGSHTSGSSGLAVWETAALASTVSAFRKPGEGITLQTDHKGRSA